MIKLFGSLLLALTGVILSVSVNRFEQKKLTILDAFITLLFYIKGQIDCFSLPLGEILKSAPTEVSCLRAHNDDSFLDMLYNCKIYLDAESFRLLERFGMEFGGMYREEQLRRCDYYIEALCERRRVIFEDLPARKKIGGTLCICVCIGLLIILW